MVALFDWFKARANAPVIVTASPAFSRNQVGALALPAGYSWQNPAWSADMSALSLTRFDRYNDGHEMVVTFTFATNTLKYLSSGVSQPGACWHRTHGVIFSHDSDVDAEGDAIYRATSGGSVIKLLGLRGLACYEPSWSPDASQFAVEVHMKGQAGSGRIAIGDTVSGKYDYITKLGLDCRQPNWDPRTNRIVYQRQRNSQKDVWDLYVQSPQADALASNICRGTDATWTPTSNLLFSGEDGLRLANLAAGSNVEAGPRGDYKGAPSMSPDGKWIACEASDRDPDNGPGTRIEIFAS